MTKNFNLQEDEKLCIFVTKDKKASYYFDNDLHRVFTGFDNKSGFEFLILDCILKIIKEIGSMTPRRFKIYLKPLSWNTQPKNKLKVNAEIIAQTKDIQDVWNFHLFVQEGLVWLKVLLNSSLNLQNTRTLRLSNHIPHMSFSIWDTYIL